MTQGLKPCPFCGGTNISVCDSTTLRTVFCHSCVIYITIETWNTRPIEDALRAEVARLRAALDIRSKAIATLRTELALAVKAKSLHAKQDEPLSIEERVQMEMDRDRE